jgi:hypothetical protein
MGARIGFLVSFGILGMLFLSPSLAGVLGQDRDKAATQVKPSGAVDNDAQVIKLTGRLEEWNVGALIVVDDSGAKKTVYLPEKPWETRYEGTAELAFLQPGTLMRFTTELSDQGQAKGNVTELEVFTVDASRPGLRTAEEIMKMTPGIHAADESKANVKFEKSKGKASKEKAAAKSPENASSKPAEKTSAKPNEKVNKGPMAEKSGGKNSPAGPTSYRRVQVVGSLLGMQNNMLMLNCGGQPLQVPVDAKVKISVRSSGLQLARPSDKVSISGLFSPKTPEQIKADSLTITGAKPLGSEIAAAGKGKTKSKGGEPAKDAKTKPPR